MYAVIESGGKQHIVSVGNVIEVELLGLAAGEVEFKEVLLVSAKGHAEVGAPHVGYVVDGEVLGTVKGPKVIALKYKRRKNYRRKVGHRQKYTQVKITGIRKVA